MLKHIPKSITPELMRLMMEMGHGETLLVCDANYPWRSIGCEHIFLPVHQISSLLNDILYFLPLDNSQPYATIVMESAMESGAYARYTELLAQLNLQTKLHRMERFNFYALAQKVIGVIVTADTAKGGNILLTKGVIQE